MSDKVFRDRRALPAEGSRRIRAAMYTVVARFAVHSLHGYFLRPGNPEAHTILLVDRIRDGRSFCTRRVTGVQAGKAIFVMSASFHVGDDGPAHLGRDAARAASRTTTARPGEGARPDPVMAAPRVG